MRIAHLDGDPYCSLTLPTREPLCAVCDEPIRWQLDLFTFLQGADRRLAHARCACTRSRLEQEARRMWAAPCVGL